MGGNTGDMSLVYLSPAGPIQHGASVLAAAGQRRCQSEDDDGGVSALAPTLAA